MSDRKAVVLLSGGLDSATTLAIARKEDFQCYALTFVYGQRHQLEVDSARKIAISSKAAGHRIMNIDLASFGGSALTEASTDIPKNRNQSEIKEKIPSTYVPARNLIFLSYALAWAEVIRAFDIFIGVNAVDYSGYPDCRPDFIRAFRKTANIATAAGAKEKQKFEIHTPIIGMSKAEIILTGNKLNVDYSLTHSCYDPDEKGRSCGRCDACRLRLKGFKQAGLRDPVEYVVSEK